MVAINLENNLFAKFKDAIPSVALLVFIIVFEKCSMQSAKISSEISLVIYRVKN